MVYATVDDVAARLGRELTTAETVQAGAFIVDVSGLVEVFCRRQFPDPPPAAVKAVVCTEVIRLLNTSPGITRSQTGDLEVEYTGVSGGLSSAAMKVLTAYRVRVSSVRLSPSTWTEDP